MVGPVSIVDMYCAWRFVKCQIRKEVEAFFLASGDAESSGLRRHIDDGGEEEEEEREKRSDKR